jgi:hypothetical protein
MDLSIGSIGPQQCTSAMYLSNGSQQWIRWPASPPSTSRHASHTNSTSVSMPRAESPYLTSKSGSRIQSCTPSFCSNSCTRRPGSSSPRRGGVARGTSATPERAGRVGEALRRAGEDLCVRLIRGLFEGATVGDGKHERERAAARRRPSSPISSPPPTQIPVVGQGRCSGRPSRSAPHGPLVAPATAPASETGGSSGSGGSMWLELWLASLEQIESILGVA